MCLLYIISAIHICQMNETHSYLSIYAKVEVLLCTTVFRIWIRNILLYHRTKYRYLLQYVRCYEDVARD